jgi:hypothetical protein
MPKLCSFEGCQNKHCAKGFCNSHWAQNNRGGILTPILTNETPEDRFKRNVKIDEKTGCWNWYGAGSGKSYDRESGTGGYGQLRIHGESWMAHRWSYSQKHKIKLTSEDTLDHLCRNTRCVNPDHLEKVSLTENVKRKALYWSLQSENIRFREFIKKMGYEPDKILGEIDEPFHKNDDVCTL